MTWRLLIRPPWRWWQSWPLRHKAEALFILLIIVAVPFDRLHPVIGRTTDDVLRAWLWRGSFIFLIIWSVASSLAIRFAPGQNTLFRLLADAPLNRREALSVTAHATAAYLWTLPVLYLVLIGAACLARPLLTWPVVVLTFSTATAVWCALFLIAGRRPALLFLSVALLILMLTAYARFAPDGILFIPFCAVLFTWVVIMYRRAPQPDLRLLLPEKAGKKIVGPRYRFTPSRVFPATAIGALYRKERLARQRFLPFVRLRRRFALAWAALLFAGWLLRADLLPIAYTAFIWVYLAFRFNDRYTPAEHPLWITGTPLRLSHWAAVVLGAELPDMIIAAFTAFMVMLPAAVPMEQAAAGISSAFLMSLFILAALMIFRLMFFDRPRWAARAFHLTVIFMAILINGYPLVGTFIALLLLGYFHYQNYRYLYS